LDDGQAGRERYGSAPLLALQPAVSGGRPHQPDPLPWRIASPKRQERATKKKIVIPIQPANANCSWQCCPHSYSNEPLCSRSPYKFTQQNSHTPTIHSIQSAENACHSKLLDGGSPISNQQQSCTLAPIKSSCNRRDHSIALCLGIKFSIGHSRPTVQCAFASSRSSVCRGHR
jgi:hypothetical protein